MTIRLDFDQLVAEAQREPIEFALPDGGPPLTVTFPTQEQAQTIDKARRSGDEQGMLLALFGLEQGERLNKFLADQPADLGGRLVRRIFTEFGVPDPSPASST